MSSASTPTSAATRVTEPADSAPLWTRGFVLLCAVTVLCYSSNLLVTVVLPLFVQQLGGSPVIAGLVFTSFSVTSFVLRPLLGHLNDRWSVKGTLLAGGTILGVFGSLFIVPSLWLAFIANAVRGIGWGAFSTSASTGVALIAPPARRGEASGYFGVVTTTAAAFAPALALTLLSTTGQFSPVFALAGAAGLGAAGAIALMPRIGSGASTFRRALVLPRAEWRLEALLDRRVLLASMLVVCATLSSPVTTAFVPVHAQAVGVQNIGLYYVAAGLTNIAARLILGRMLDRRSRGFWIAIGFSVSVAAYAVFTQSGTIEMFIGAAVLNAIGLSLTQPSLMALAMDRAEHARMGRAMATFSMFYRVGEGVGAPIAGILIVAFGYGGMYVGAMASTLVGLVLIALNWGTVGKPLARAPSP
ncbi:MAG: MFS transporter [Chloroflexi bacterium]|nr:MFS transporter [Chloroflexota bacterium]